MGILIFYCFFSSGGGTGRIVMLLMLMYVCFLIGLRLFCVEDVLFFLSFFDLAYVSCTGIILPTCFASGVILRRGAGIAFRNGTTLNGALGMAAN